MRVLKTLFFLLAFAGLCHAQIFQGRQLVNAELLADADGIVPGHSAVVGLHLQTQAGWNTYWQYSGDAGIPTTIAWTLPPGFKAGPIQWPMPQRIVEPGDIVVYGYQGDILLPVTIQVPDDLQPGQTVTFRAHATWLVCKDICVPGKADLTLTLPVVATTHPANDALFRQSRDLLPRTGAPPFSASWSSKGQTLLLDLKGLDPSTYIDFFPLPGDVQIGHPVIAAQSVRIPLLDPSAKPASIDGVVVLYKHGEMETRLVPPPGTPAREIWPLPPPSLQPSAFGLQPASPPSSLLYWLGLGFLGGLILNVMPCVLPVIALKIFGFIKQAGESPRRILALGFTFVAGIFAWFLFLAALIVSFKLAGHQLNWAFQFQHPAFVAVMVVILLLFSLNLLGVFEIVLPGRLQSRVNDAASQEGYAGTFWHGVFATLMATPCTAPFLGPARGFAHAHPAPTVFAMFGSIAAGMSAPYALLAVKPAWLRYLPRPGIWMVRVKQALGVLLMGTVLWLGWVLYQQFANRPEPFPPRLAHALAQNKIVFVDFTADWCVNCKVNERLVIDSAAVQNAFRQRGVILLKADWTSGDEGITALLRKFGRAGVPCYVVYPPGGQPIVLPEVITPDIVLHALDAAQS
jgi:thiol:disulfide interchange protein DsbD